MATGVSAKIKESKKTIPIWSASSALKPLNRNSLILFTLSFIAACTMFFSHLGDMPLFSPDEALYAEPAREMLETGEYITTYLNYQVRYTKPPLFIWAIAGAMKVFAVTEFASRFFSAACGAILVGLTYLFAEKFFNKRAAILAAFSLILAPMYLAISRLAITDIPLALFVSGALMGLFYGFRTGEKRWKWYAYVFLGLGVMTKGPVALVLPAGVLFAYHLLMGTIKKAWAYYSPIKGLALISLIALPWFVVEIWVTNGEYFDAFIMRENLQRFTGVVDHKYPWWYHLVAMFGGFFPWCLALPFAWVASIKIGKISDKSKVTTINRSKFKKLFNWVEGLRTSDHASHASHAACFSTIAALFILVFFSASVSKLLPYTLPAFPFLAVVTGYYLTRVAESSKWIPVSIGFAMFSALAAGSYFLLPVLEKNLRYCPPELIAYLPGYIGAVVVAGLVPMVVALTRRVFASFICFAMLMMSAILIYGPNLQVIFADSWEQPLKSFVQYAALSDKPIYLCNLRKPSATFYALRRVEKEETLPGLWNRLSKEESAYIIGRRRHKDSYLAKNCRLIQEQGRFILVEYNNKAEIEK